MGNNDTNADCHKFVRVGDRKYEIVEIRIRIIFFLFFIFFASDLYSLFFYTGSFQAPLKKNHPYLKSQFTTKISNWLISLLHKHSEKWLIYHQGMGGGAT